MCTPKEEGGLGFRSLHEVYNALFEKLWWNFRVHPRVVWSLGASHVCRKMLAIREEVEQGIRAREDEIEVKEFIGNGNWKVAKLNEFLSGEMIAHIVEDIKPNVAEMNDKAWWMGTATGNFTVKLAN
ncbi:hypothetical protein KY284_030293 [Solanum tuberosum]|nr:hypothetical protein KY284_030293 [Solanum tuberosum]